MTKKAGCWKDCVLAVESNSESRWDALKDAKWKFYPGEDTTGLTIEGWAYLYIFQRVICWSYAGVQSEEVVHVDVLTLRHLRIHSPVLLELYKEGEVSNQLSHTPKGGTKAPFSPFEVSGKYNR